MADFAPVHSFTLDGHKLPLDDLDAVDDGNHVQFVVEERFATDMIPRRDEEFRPADSNMADPFSLSQPLHLDSWDTRMQLAEELEGIQGTFLAQSVFGEVDLALLPFLCTEEELHSILRQVLEMKAEAEQRLLQSELSAPHELSGDGALAEALASPPISGSARTKRARDSVAVMITDDEHTEDILALGESVAVEPQKKKKKQSKTRENKYWSLHEDVVISCCESNGIRLRPVGTDRSTPSIVTALLHLLTALQILARVDSDANLVCHCLMTELCVRRGGVKPQRKHLSDIPGVALQPAPLDLDSRAQVDYELRQMAAHWLAQWGVPMRKHRDNFSTASIAAVLLEMVKILQEMCGMPEYQKACDEIFMLWRML